METFEEKTQETEEKNEISLKVVVDLTLVLICGILIPIVWHGTIPTRQGFFCDDESIMYPAKPSTISNTALWCFSVLVPVGIICITEVIRMYTVKVAKESKTYFFKWKVPEAVQQIYKYSSIFLIGLIMSELSNDFIKTLIGRPRPSFLDFCKPDFNCSSVTNPHYYVTDYKCTNPELKNESYIRESFPSGHTALSMYASFYILFYLSRKMTFKKFGEFPKLLLLWILLMPSGFISLTRIRDNMHHWDDILGGFFVGFFICLAMIFCYTDLYRTALSRIVEDA